MLTLFFAIMLLRHTLFCQRRYYFDTLFAAILVFIAMMSPMLYAAIVPA